ncbi:MAG: hypothetical protein PHN51_11550, partial [Candidatus Nanopelagicales bacterium]|nr:hypothetical protein [Candidatus Nanopelagicales bacterium]
MATKKSGKESEEFDMGMDFDDMGDFDDMSFDDEDSLGSSDRKPSTSTVAKELGMTAGEGFLEELVTKSAKNVLPEEYEAGYYEAMDLANYGKEVFDTNKAKLTKSTYRLGKEVAKALPFKIKMLDDFLEDKASEFEQMKQQSEEQMRNSAISSDLASIFDKQIEVQKAISAQESAEGEVEKKERIVQSQMSMDVMSNIDRNTSRYTEFTVQIAKEYYRKSLELQYKSYFVQADTLKNIKDHFKAFSIQFTNIEKNTALPEFVKLQKTESLQQLIRDQATQRVYDQMFTNSKFMDTFKKKAASYVGQKVGAVTDSMDTFTDILGQMNSAGEMGGPSGLMMGVDAVAGMGGGLLGEYAADKIPQDLRDKIKGNKTIKTGGNILSMLVNSPSTLLKTAQQMVTRKNREFETDDTMSGQLGRGITGGLADLLGSVNPDKPNLELKTENYLSHNQPAIFDKKVHRSLTEVIPLYLARLLARATDLNAMYRTVNPAVANYEDSEPLLYDYEKRGLDTRERIQSNLEASIFKGASAKDKAKSSSKEILAKISSTVSSDRTRNKPEVKALNKLLGSKSAEEAMAKYIEKAREIHGDKLDYDKLMNTEDEQNKLLINDIKGLRPLLDEIKKANIDTKAMSQISGRMKDSNRKYPIEAVKEMFAGASRIAKSQPLNLIKDETAEIISEIFSRFVYRTGQSFSFEGLMTGRDWSIPEKYESNQTVLDAFSVLSADLKKIDRAGDTESIWAMNALIAITYKSVTSGQNTDPSVFQTVKDLYPEIVTQKEVSIENLLEAKIGDFSNTRYMAISDIRELTR